MLLVILEFVILIVEFENVSNLDISELENIPPPALVAELPSIFEFIMLTNEETEVKGGGEEEYDLADIPPPKDKILTLLVTFELITLTVEEAEFPDEKT